MAFFKYISQAGADKLLYTGEHFQFIGNLETLSTELKNILFAEISSGSHIQILDSDYNKLPRIVKNFNALSQTGYIKFDAPSTTGGVTFYLNASASYSESDSILAATNTHQYDWALDDVSSPAIDDCGNANLTITGTNPFNGDQKIIGNSFALDDTNITKISNSTALRIERTQAFSVSFWFRKRVHASSFILDHVAGDSTLRGIRIAYHTVVGFYMTLFSNNNTNNRLFNKFTSFSPANDTWYYITFTYNGTSQASGITFRANKQNYSRASDSDTLTDTIYIETPLWLGSNNGDSPLDGYLDNYQIAYRVKSTEEIDQSYNNLITADFWTVSEEVSPFGVRKKAHLGTGKHINGRLRNA